MNRIKYIYNYEYKNGHGKVVQNIVEKKAKNKYYTINGPMLYKKAVSKNCKQFMIRTYKFKQFANKFSKQQRDDLLYLYSFGSYHSVQDYYIKKILTYITHNIIYLKICGFFKKYSLVTKEYYQQREVIYKKKQLLKLQIENQQFSILTNKEWMQVYAMTKTPEEIIEEKKQKSEEEIQITKDEINKLEKQQVVYATNLVSTNISIFSMIIALFTLLVTFAMSDLFPKNALKKDNVSKHQQEITTIDYEEINISDLQTDLELLKIDY